MKIISFGTIILLLLSVVGCKHPLQARVKMQGDLTAQTYTPFDHRADPVSAETLEGNRCSDAVALIDVDGLLLNRNLLGPSSFGENPVALFKEKLDAAAADPRVGAVVLRINSHGGGVTASDIMRRDLAVFKHRTGKPVVACIVDVGAGGAYYLATAADSIVAHPTALTGGTGVILNLYLLKDAMLQQNIQAKTIRSGENADLGSAVNDMEEEQEELLQQIADEYHERFKGAVIASRRLSDPEETTFDGRVFTAGQSLQRGLIDQVGYLDDALHAARQLAGLNHDSQVVIYRRCHDRALTKYDITPNMPGLGGLFPLSVPGIDRSQLPRYLYMWQPEPLMEKTGGN